MKVLSAVVCMLLMLQFMATREAKSQDIPEDTLKMIEANKFSKETVRELFEKRMQEQARRHKQSATSAGIIWRNDEDRKRITHLEIEVRTQDDLARLRNMNVDCCADLGWCECDLTLEKVMEIKSAGIGYRTVNEQELETRKEQWERMCQLVDRIRLGPNDVIAASVQVNDRHDLLFLQNIGMDCCQNAGICKCHITKQQWKHLGARRFAYQANVRDTTTWGKETKPKSRMEPPPKKP